MANLVLLVKMIACLAGGIALGNWFLNRVRQGKRRGEPWYKAYMSAPGLVVILALILLPTVLWLTRT